MGAEAFGTALLGRIDDPATSRWARAQLRRTTLATAVSAMRAVGAFTAGSRISQIDVPAAVIVTARDRCRAARPPAGAGPAGQDRVLR